MKDRENASGSIRAPTLVIGPQAAGRGYRVLSRSSGPTISPKADSRITELALVIAGWADEREPRAAALIRLDDDPALWLLIRATYLGAAPLGTVAFAHGVLVADDAMKAIGGRPERLLASIPEPDGSLSFGEEPATLDLDTGQPPPRDWSRLGLEWRDRLVIVPPGAESETILRSILAAAGPISAGSRLRGWATTALFPANGGFEPQDAFQLIVTDSDARVPPSLRYLRARVTGAGWEGDRVPGSPTTQTWERFKRIGETEASLRPAFRTLEWSQKHLALEPAELLNRLGHKVLRPLAGAARMRLIMEMAHPQGEELDPIFAAAARALLERLLTQSDLEPQHVAYYIRSLAEGPAEAVAAINPLGAWLVRPGTAPWLQGRTFARLLQLGYADALARQTGDPLPFLDGFGQDDLAALVDRLIEHGVPAPGQLGLLSTLARLLADGGDGAGRSKWAMSFENALAQCLELGSPTQLRRLASRTVVRGTLTFARSRFAILAKRVIHLRGAHVPERPDEFAAMLGASLEWIKLAGAGK